MRPPRPRPLILAALLAAGFLGSAVAQEPIPEPQGPPVVDYSFATHMGTGVYDVEGRRVYILRIPISFRLRPTRVDRWGIKFLLPMTAGFHDFQFRDLAGGKLPDHVTTVSIVPGVEFEHWVAKNWRLRPYAHLGAGKDLQGGSLTAIYDLGIMSRVVIPWKRWEFSIGNELLYAGSTAIDDGATSLFVRFDTGFDARRPLGLRVKMREQFFSVFFINHFFVNPVEFGRGLQDPVTVRNTVEFGLALGMEPPAKMIGIKIPQVGMSVELGPDLVALKFSMGFRY